ncbi:MAG: HD domain-containing protein [Desulfoplanes sp.]|nr:HD domain-containing protein [Desulfoplanes sp.]MDD4649121.1 HD domain-containing protein [Desulfoplanes sp.]
MIEKKIYIRDLKAGIVFDDVFALTQAQLNQAKNGPYWQLTLQDRTGSLGAKIWSPLSQNYEGLTAEQFVRIQGRISTFKDQLQATITTLAVLDPVAEAIDRSQFLPSSAVPPEDLLSSIETILHQEILYPDWRKLYKKILGTPAIRQALLTAPGGKSIHHAYCGGLLEHTLGVVNICRSMSDLYPQLDREMLLIAATFHDLGKAFELTHGISREYTSPGKLLGHIQMGLEVIEPFLQKSKLEPGLILHFKHIILSHHGQYDYGSPKLPMTTEAMVLHMADNLDAKINTMTQALHDTETESWSGFQRSLQRDLFQPQRTPKPTISKIHPAKKEDQCSLPLKV